MIIKRLNTLSLQCSLFPYDELQHFSFTTSFNVHIDPYFSKPLRLDISHNILTLHINQKDWSTSLQEIINATEVQQNVLLSGSSTSEVARTMFLFSGRWHTVHTEQHIFQWSYDSTFVQKKPFLKKLTHIVTGICITNNTAQYAVMRCF